MEVYRDESVRNDQAVLSPPTGGRYSELISVFLFCVARKRSHESWNQSMQGDLKLDRNWCGARGVERALKKGSFPAEVDILERPSALALVFLCLERHTHTPWARRARSQRR
jgi:hypothetical protein